MNVETIQMPREEARERLQRYKKALRRGADAEYSAAVAGYEALAAGTPLVQYGQAILNAGFDEKGLPRLAVSRADRTQLRVERFWRGGIRFSSTALKGWDRRMREGSLLILHVDEPEQPKRTFPDGYALVPMVPPEALSAAGGRSHLKDHLILWEVEEWAPRPFTAWPDKDPLLLRPLGAGDLCAVVAAWDLTDLERAVMSGRAR